MKTIDIKILIGVFSVVILFSCNEEEFLKEKPLDFLTTGNAYVTLTDFESGVNDLYARYRDFRYGGSFGNSLYATDIFFDARKSNSIGRFGNYDIALNPTSGLVEGTWDNLYKIIANANTIIGRLQSSNLNNEEKARIEAEARFFRGFAYRHLVYYYGGVPLVVEEIDEPKSDFTKAEKNEILNQIREDLAFASDNLQDVQDVPDGKLSNLVALHYLAETLISLGNYSEAINATSTIIDHPGTSLMTERFGTRSGEPGDVYWDLFRRDNQNRATGNTEALWVAQMEIDVPGGFLSTSSRENILERAHVPVVRSLNDPNGDNAMLTQRSDANQGGRGVSFMQPTSFFENDLWESDFDNDIRNSQFNYVRDVFYDDPDSPFFGMSAKDNPGPVFLSSTWRWYPWLTKVTTPGNHPDNLYEDKELGILNSSAGSTYTDQYILRLAETHLLRAEAYLANGEPEKAADDINAVRVRANATPVASIEVDIDYILDERARELSFEENRRITLQRLGRLVERVRLYNAHNADEIQDYHEIWPIPFAEIEANINADLTQNPGY